MAGKSKVCRLTSEKFIRQKIGYVHMNPVRAGLCEHPAEWRWSSYHAYLPHKPGTVPIEMDRQWYWTHDELNTDEQNGGQRPPANGGDEPRTVATSPRIG